METPDLKKRIELLYEYYNQQKSLFQELKNQRNIFKNREKIINQKEAIPNEETSSDQIENKDFDMNIAINYKNKNQINSFLQRNPKKKDQLIQILLQEALKLNKILRELNTEDEKELFTNEIKQILATIEWIKTNDFKTSITQEKEEEKNTTPKEKKNKLVYLKRSNERIELYENIVKDIPTELYEDLKILLQSIIDGTLKGDKKLTIRNYRQVSYHQIRILYYQLNQNTYLILTGFQKDFQLQTQYLKNLTHFDEILNQQLEIYKLLIKNTYFMEQEEKVTEDIMKLLSKEKEVNNGSKLSRK